MHNTKPIHWCDVVQNLVVDFELLFVRLFVPHVWLISQEENCPIMIPKILKNGRGVVSNLLV